MYRNVLMSKLKLSPEQFRQLLDRHQLKDKSEYTAREVEILTTNPAPSLTTEQAPKTGCDPDEIRTQPGNGVAPQGAMSLIQAENAAIGGVIGENFNREKTKNRQIAQQTDLVAEHIAEERALLLHPQTLAAKISDRTLAKLGGEVPPLELPALGDLMVLIAPVFELPGSISQAALPPSSDF